MLQPQSHHERTASLSTGPSTGSMMGWEHLGCSSMPTMPAALGGPRILGDPPRGYSFSWATLGSGGWPTGCSR